jgi:molecular chaperone DnaK
VPPKPPPRRSSKPAASLVVDAEATATYATGRPWSELVEQALGESPGPLLDATRETGEVPRVQAANKDDSDEEVVELLDDELLEAELLDDDLVEVDADAGDIVEESLVDEEVGAGDVVEELLVDEEVGAGDVVEELLVDEEVGAGDVVEESLVPEDASPDRLVFGEPDGQSSLRDRSNANGPIQLDLDDLRKDEFGERPVDDEQVSPPPLEQESVVPVVGALVAAEERDAQQAVPPESSLSATEGPDEVPATAAAGVSPPQAVRPSAVGALQGDAGGLRQINVRSRVAVRPPTRKQVPAEAPMVGIDFGTAYSKVAVVVDGEVTLIEDTESQASTRAAIPSVVAFTPDGRCLVGDPARDMLATNPGQVVTSVKRVMGLTYSDPLANGLLGSLACQSHAGPNDSILFDVHGQSYTVPQIVACVLEHLRDMASRWLGVPVKRAVFTVPVEFDGRAKRELEMAARQVGLEIMGLIPEPVAAAMGCGHDGSGDSLVAVYDFGGGTFDASLVQVGQQRFSVRGAAGDRWLGGDDFDEMLGRYVADEFQKTTGVGLHNRAEEWQRLLFASEEAKRWLSTLESVDVVLPRAANAAEGPVTLLVPMTRSVFEEVVDDIITSSLEVVQTAASRAQIQPSEVDTLLVTGGTTRIPAVRQAAEQFFGQRCIAGIHPEHAVVIGAAVRAAVLSKVKLPADFIARLRGLGSVGRSIGLALAGGVTEHIILSSQRPPVSAHRLYSTSRDNQTTIRLELVHGSSQVTAENQRVGGFVIEGLPARKAGAISLDVYFELSTSGTLYVTAQERSSGRRAQGAFNVKLG